MSNIDYQNIEYINVSSKNDNYDIQLDTTGKINEKIDNNTYNYFIDNINVDTQNKNKIIKLVNENNNYIIKEKIAENVYQQFNPPISTTVFNKADNSTFTLIDINSNVQNWERNDYLTMKDNKDDNPTYKTVNYITKDINSVNNKNNETLSTKAYVDESKGNYHVNSITDFNPENPPSGNTNDLILAKENDNLTLKIHDGTYWNDYDVAIGSICIVQDKMDIYVRLSDIDEHQNWQYTEINISEVENVTHFYPELIKNNDPIDEPDPPTTNYIVYKPTCSIEGSKFLIQKNNIYHHNINVNNYYKYIPTENAKLTLNEYTNLYLEDFSNLSNLVVNNLYKATITRPLRNVIIYPDRTGEFHNNLIYLYYKHNDQSDRYYFIICDIINYDFSFNFVKGKKYISYNQVNNPAFITDDNNQNYIINKNKIYLCTKATVDVGISMKFTFKEIDPVNKQIVHCLTNGQQLIYYKVDDNNEKWTTLGIGKIDENTSTGEIFNSYTGDNKNIASGDYSHAEGNYTTASGQDSHAEGNYTTASGQDSHAEGNYTTASGDYSHAEGGYTIASGGDSHAEGDHTKALGKCSHASGSYTVADKENMTAIGKYNVYDSNDSTLNDGKLFVVGNGTNNNNRNDAFVVYDNGRTTIHSLNINYNMNDNKYFSYIESKISSKDESLNHCCYNLKIKQFYTCDSSYSWESGTYENKRLLVSLIIKYNNILSIEDLKNINIPNINVNDGWEYSPEQGYISNVYAYMITNKHGYFAYYNPDMSINVRFFMLLDSNDISMCGSTTNIGYGTTYQYLAYTSNGELEYIYDNSILEYNSNLSVNIMKSSSSNLYYIILPTYYSNRTYIYITCLYNNGTKDDIKIYKYNPFNTSIDSSRYKFLYQDIILNHGILCINDTVNNISKFEQFKLNETSFEHNYINNYEGYSNICSYMSYNEQTNYLIVNINSINSDTAYKINIYNILYKTTDLDQLNIITISNVNKTFTITKEENYTYDITSIYSDNNIFYIMCKDNTDPNNIKNYIACYQNKDLLKKIPINSDKGEFQNYDSEYSGTEHKIIWINKENNNDYIVITNYNYSNNINNTNNIYGETYFYNNVVFNGSVTSSSEIIIVNSSNNSSNNSLSTKISNKLKDSRLLTYDNVISICDNYENIYILQILSSKYLIKKYNNYNQFDKYIELSTDSYTNITNIYAIKDILLFINNQDLYSINLLNKDLQPNLILSKSNINKIVIDPINDNIFYILYNSEIYYSKCIYENNEFTINNYNIITSNNDQNDLNIINILFCNDNIYLINSLYNNTIIYYVYEDNKFIKKSINNNQFTNYDYIDVYIYNNNLYYLLVKDGLENIIVKINTLDNTYQIFENIIVDNITKYNKNIYYKYNSEYFYLVSDKYIYYYSISNETFTLENKLYAENCKYITNNQDIYITDNSICNINNGFIVNGEILLNGTIKTSSINAAQINVQDIDVNVNKTITHNTLIVGELENYQVGQPVFIKDNKTYTLQRKSNDGKYPVYEYVEIKGSNYVNNPINQIPIITNENNSKFIGVITAIYPANTPLKINEITSNYIKINNDTIDFATHGDYIFKVDNNTAEHQTTSGNMKLYEIGDEIMYDGRIIDPEHPLTRKLEKMIVGTITCIPEDNTDYVSVFKV